MLRMADRVVESFTEESTWKETNETDDWERRKVEKGNITTPFFFNLDEGEDMAQMTINHCKDQVYFPQYLTTTEQHRILESDNEM